MLGSDCLDSNTRIESFLHTRAWSFIVMSHHLHLHHFSNHKQQCTCTYGPTQHILPTSTTFPYHILLATPTLFFPSLSLIRVVKTERLMANKSISESIPGLLAYSERHYSRVDRYAGWKATPSLLGLDLPHAHLYICMLITRT